MIRVGAVCAPIALAAYAVAIKSEPPSRDAAYVGSAACRECHLDVYSSWKDSLHRKMMRPVDEAGALVVDLDSAPAGSVESGEVVWVIGSKWEQQFMGRDGEGETLLPGVFRRISGDWDPIGWDGWQTPVPQRRCHGCHTVGLDITNGSFTEAGIGCESCHGPAMRHVETLGLAPLHSSADAQVCGQCHIRGKSTDGPYFFPVGFRPGDDLLARIDPLEPIPAQNTTRWWGNGHERSRHQEFSAWRHTAHARSLEALREGYDGRFGAVESSCLGCHSGDYILARDDKPTVTEARFGITCAVCHQTHGALSELRSACTDCHTHGPMHHAPDSRDSEPHVPCPPSAQVGCVSCHMPQVVQSGGDYALHSHADAIIPPGDAEEFGTPTSCSNGGCHADRDPTWLSRAFAAHYRRRPKRPGTTLVSSHESQPLEVAVRVGSTTTNANVRDAWNPSDH